MGALVFPGLLLGLLGFGICGLGVVVTLDQHGLAEWKTALLWSLLAVCSLGLAAFSAYQAEKMELRHQASERQTCCKRYCCGCEKCKECIKGERNGRTEDQR